MIKKPDGWRVVASMDRVQAEHPDWTEKQCRAEFNRISHAAIEAHVSAQLAKAEARRRRRAAR